MGSRGIRHRKPEHHLPKVHGHITPDDEARALGQFTWDAWTPAGSLERHGFAMRQLARRRHEPHHGHSDLALTLVMIVYGALIVGVVYGVLALWLFLWHLV